MYSIPKHGVNTRSGATANNSSADIDGGSIKLTGEKVHDRFRKSKPTNVMGFPQLHIGLIDGTANVVPQVVNSIDVLDGFNPLSFYTNQSTTGFKVGDAIGVSVNGEIRVGRVTVLATNWLETTINAEDFEDGGDVYYYGTVNDTAPLITASKPNVTRRKLHSVNAVRTVKTATSIRSGSWNEVTGEFETAPEEANDLSAMGADKAVETDGEYGIRNRFTVKAQNEVLTGDA